MSIKIINAGAMSTIQDLGRKNQMRNGFSPNGVMDIKAMKLANLLVGNQENEAVIEMTMTGITAIFYCDAIIAVTGADFTPLINNKPVPMNTTIKVGNGQILRLPKAVNGCRCYLAVKGGYDIPLIMDSRSTNLKCQIGGYEGRKLENKDVIKLNKHTVDDYEIKSYPYVPYKNSVTIRVVLGPQDDYFTQRGINTFLNSEYYVTPFSDRMGMKLDGDGIESSKGYDIISDAIPLGSIQIPSNGKPIILMQDRQTTGGYPKIATVISADISLLAQLKPTDKIRFKAVSVEQAQKILIDEV